MLDSFCFVVKDFSPHLSVPEVGRGIPDNVCNDIKRAKIGVGIQEVPCESSSNAQNFIPEMTKAISLLDADFFLFGDSNNSTPNSLVMY